MSALHQPAAWGAHRQVRCGTVARGNGPKHAVYQASDADAGAACERCVEALGMLAGEKPPLPHACARCREGHSFLGPLARALTQRPGRGV